MRVTMILEFPASYCHLSRGIAQVYIDYIYNSDAKGYLHMFSFSCPLMSKMYTNKNSAIFVGRQLCWKDHLDFCCHAWLYECMNGCKLLVNKKERTQ